MIRVDVREVYARRDRSQRFAGHLSVPISPNHQQNGELMLNLAGDLTESSGLPEVIQSDELVIMSAQEYERLVSKKVTE